MVEKWDPALGPPGPRVIQDPMDPGTSGPLNLRTLGKLPLPFEIQNLNTQRLSN